MKQERRKKVNEVTREYVRAYPKSLSDSGKATRINTLKTLKVLFRDFLGKPEVVETFKFPKQVFKPKIISTKAELRKFYEAIDSLKEKALFLMYASSGLRRMEILGLKRMDIDFEKRMIKPKAHSGETKKVWISFFNKETEESLTRYIASRKDDNLKLFPFANSRSHKLWNSAREKIGLNITPQRLREWFCVEMTNLGVPDRYIDAFCGRTPKSVLAKHYNDYSPKLRQIYDKANLKVLV